MMLQPKGRKLIFLVVHFFQKEFLCVRYEIFTVVKIHIAIFWVLTSCSLVGSF